MYSSWRKVLASDRGPRARFADLIRFDWSVRGPECASELGQPGCVTGAMKRQREGYTSQETKAKRARTDTGELVVPKDNSDFASLLQCPVCYELLGPPVWQCREGHPLCNSCRQQIVSGRCPTCRTTDNVLIRCLALEQLLQTMRVRCKHGCGSMIDFERKHEHEQFCERRPARCFDNSCAWTGSCDQWVAHLTTTPHKILFQDHRTSDRLEGRCAHHRSIPLLV